MLVIFFISIELLEGEGERSLKPSAELLGNAVDSDGFGRREF